jgi:hypothetical protein
MIMSTARNYHAQGGNHWVIGGKLTFLPGAVIEGGEGLFGNTDPDIPLVANQPDSDATTVAALRADFNALLAALRGAGYMVVDATGGQATIESNTTEPTDPAHPPGESGDAS